MLKINIICVGSIKEKFFTEAINEYSKRLSRFCFLNIVEIQEESSLETNKKIEKETNKLIELCKGDIFVLDREGKELSSLDLAETIKKEQNLGSELSFVIGGSNGVSQQILKMSKQNISFGKITFPHQLFRVVLLEQIYRAFMINSNSSYHK